MNILDMATAAGTLEASADWQNYLTGKLLDAIDSGDAWGIAYWTPMVREQRTRVAMHVEALHNASSVR